MFYGMPARIINKDGKGIQGTLGFVGALLKMICREEPTHVVALFDGEQGNSRMSLDTAYKANRPDYGKIPYEETPFSQLADVYAALNFLGIAHMETVDCETDDVVAGYAHTYGQNTRIEIVSYDSDFFQLITDTVTVLRYRGGKTVACDALYLQKRFGIRPAQYAEFKSLTGDTADSIRGAEKIGPKTAARLLAEFGTLENSIAGNALISKPSIRESIIRSAERLRRNYKLIYLDGKTALPFLLDELAYRYDGATTNAVLAGIGLR